MHWSETLIFSKKRGFEVRRARHRSYVFSLNYIYGQNKTLRLVASNIKTLDYEEEILETRARILISKFEAQEVLGEGEWGWGRKGKFKREVPGRTYKIYRLSVIAWWVAGHGLQPSVMRTPT